MANQGVIGSAVIEVTVDSSKIATGMGRARAETERSAAAVASGADKASASLKKQAGEFTGAIARISAVSATFVLFLRIGQQIREVLKSGTDRAREFVTVLDTRNPTDALAKINTEIAAVEDRLESATRSFEYFATNLLYGDTPGKMQDQLRLLRSTAQTLQQFENAKTRAAETRRQDAAVAALKAQSDALVQAAGEGPDAIVAKYAKQYRDADALAKTAKSQRERDAAAELAITINNAMATDLAQFKLEQQIKTLEERNRIAEEWAEIQAKAREQIEAQNAAIRAQQMQVKQGTFDATNRMVTGIEDLGQKLDALNQQIRGMR